MATWITNQYVTATTTSDMWCQWNNCTTSTTTPVWLVWNTTGTGNTINQNCNLYAQQGAPPITPEMIAAREAQNAKWKKIDQERKVAADQAMRLLRDNLSPKQIKALDKHGWFLVEGGKSKKTYRIRNDSYTGNIYELDGDKEVARFCVHAHSEIPLGDQLLAQAISIQWDEDHIISKANKTRLTA
jgi:hypothetical protein